MVERVALVLDMTDRLLGDLADAVPPFRAVGDALSTLAVGLGVEKVIVAIDDARLGRQVFCSGRVQLGDEGVGLWGPPGAWTQPPSPFDTEAIRLLVQAVGIGVVRSSAPARVMRTLDVGVVGSSGLADAVANATARAVRHRWGFTLVLVRGEPGIAEALTPRLRAADSLIAVSDTEIALLLPETAGDRVPLVLSRLAEGAGIAPFSYGLACCPADSRDPGYLYRTAAERLETALAGAPSGTEPTALEAPAEPPSSASPMAEPSSASPAAEPPEPTASSPTGEPAEPSASPG